MWLFCDLIAPLDAPCRKKAPDISHYYVCASSCLVMLGFQNFSLHPDPLPQIVWNWHVCLLEFLAHNLNKTNHKKTMSFISTRDSQKAAAVWGLAGAAVLIIHQVL
jgi:hypothetical protein